MIEVKDLKTLRKLKYNNKKNETALVKENNVLYKWNGETWKTAGKPGINASLYQINQAIYTSMPELSEEEIIKRKEIIFNYTVDFYNSNYFMLLNNENRYYTLFDTGNGEKAPNAVEDEVINCLHELGAIKEIELTDQNTIECWVTKDNISSVYYFFDYSQGVIKCK